MGKSKVIYNDETLIDLSGDTVTEETLAEGITAHNSNGDLIVGELVVTNSIIASGKCGQSVDWVLYDNGVLSISGTGEMYNDVESLIFAHIRQDIKKVIIEDGVTSVGDYIFRGCSNIVDIEFPNSITFLGRQSFSSCTSLTDIKFPSGITSINREVFYDCTAIESVTIPSNVIVIGDNAFYGCKNHVSVFYVGTKSQWDDVLVSFYGNECIYNATLYCEYEDVSDADTVDGWHVNVISDGSDPGTTTKPTIHFVYTAG